MTPEDITELTRLAGILEQDPAYSLAEIQHAFDAAVEKGDWEDFQANLYTPTNQGAAT